MKYAIALKINPIQSTPNMGYIKPYLKEQNGELTVSIPQDFPKRNSIVIHKGYESLDTKFDNGELFKIPYEDSTGGDTEHPNYAWYQANGYNAEKISSLELFHVIDENVNFENRQIQNLRYKPTRAIFVVQKLLPKYLFGPFRHTYEQNLDGNYTVLLEPYPKLTQIDSSNDWFILKIKKTHLKSLRLALRKFGPAQSKI